MLDANQFQAGLDAMRAGDFPKAEQIFSRLVAAEPRMHQAWHMLATIATLSGMPDVGLERARKALEFDRRNPFYLNLLAVALGEMGRLEEGKASLLKALREKPTYAEAHYNLGKTLFKMYDFKAASAAYGRAYALNPDYPGLLFNWAYTKKSLKDYSGARTLLKELLAKDPTDADAAVQLSEVESVGMGDEVFEAYLEGFVRANPQFSPVRQRLGVHYLSQGKFERGWSEYWYRMPLPKSVREARHGESIPILPPSLNGRSVLVRIEQGIGDMLFFLRFTPFLKSRGARVVAEVHDKLVPVLQAVPSIDQVISYDSSADPLRAPEVGADITVWAADLPLLLGEFHTPPALTLTADPTLVSAWRERLAKAGPAPYLGLTWRAGTDASRSSEFDPNREVNRALSKSIGIDPLAKAVATWPGTFVCMQREPYSEDFQTMQKGLPRQMLDLSEVNNNLTNMLALLACLDDYVCVSNTNVHLRAGLGLGGKVLLPELEFRWMATGEESPWFPGWKLYRKNQDEGWDAALLKLRRDLSGNAVS